MFVTEFGTYQLSLAENGIFKRLRASGTNHIIHGEHHNGLFNQRRMDATAIIRTNVLDNAKTRAFWIYALDRSNTN